MLFRLPKVIQVMLLTLMLIGMGWPSALPMARAAEVPQALDGDLNICDEGEGTGGISGTVTRADSGEPLEDAEIRISTLYDTTITGTGSRFTNEDGFYEITDLPGGTYVVQVRPKFDRAADGSATSPPIFQNAFYDGQLTASTFTPVQVVDTQITTNIDFALARGGIIRGRVTDLQSGMPISGQVALYNEERMGDGVKFQNITPAANGYYTFEVGLPSGGYKVEYESLEVDHAPKFYQDKEVFEEATVIEIVGTEVYTADLAVTLVPLDPAPSGVITGQITLDDPDAPLPTFSVVAYRVDEVTMFPSRFGSVGPEGRYTVEVPPGSYMVRASVAGFFGPSTPDSLNPQDFAPRLYGAGPDLDQAEVVEVTDGATVTDIDITLTLGGGRITGRITTAKDGTGLEDAGVVARMVNSSLCSNRYFVATLTDATGAYTLPAVADGVYTVSTAPGQSDCRYTATEHSELVTVSGNGVVPNIDIAAVEGAYVTGRITVAETGAGSDAVNVQALREGETIAAPFHGRFVSDTGHYRIGPIDPDRYQIQFTPAHITGLGETYYDNAAKRADAQFVELDAGEILGAINAVLTEATDEPDDPVYMYLPSLEQ